MKKLVSIKQPIQVFMDYFDLEETRKMPMWVQWAKDADERIGSLYNYTKEIKVLDVEDCSAELPPCAAKLEWVVRGDYGCDCGLMFDEFNTTFKSKVTITPATDGTGVIVIDSGGSFTMCLDIPYEVIDNKIVFAGNFNGDKVTARYWAHASDDEGMPLVNENHVDAIAQYLTWRHTAQERRRGKAHFTAGDVAMEKEEWRRMCANARALDVDDTDQERNQIADIINNPLKGGPSTTGLSHPTDY